uniref:Uncharacterized protein n=1 Tax=Arundo donax TaxID=35708 RepID=A0A0A9BC52_ARUDO
MVKGKLKIHVVKDKCISESYY